MTSYFQVSRWHLLILDPASNTWRPSWSFLLQPTSLTFAVGLVWLIKSAMPSLWLSGWPHFINSWSPPPISTGISIWTHSSWNPSSILCLRLGMVSSASLIRVSQHALLRIQDWDRVPAVPETLKAILLSWWMPHHSSGHTVHAPGWILVCTYWGWGPGSSQCTGQSLILHSWLFQPYHCCGSQTAAADIRGLVNWCYLEPPYQEPEGEDTVLSVPHDAYPWCEEQSCRPTGSECPFYGATKWHCCCTGLCLLPLPSALHCSFLAGRHVSEPQSPSKDIDDVVLDALSNLKTVTWDLVRLATAMTLICKNGLPLSSLLFLTISRTYLSPFKNTTSIVMTFKTPMGSFILYKGQIIKPPPISLCPSRCDHWHTSSMWSLQLCCPNPTQLSTCSAHFPCLSIPMCLCRYVLLRRCVLLGGGRQILQLDHIWGG